MPSFPDFQPVPIKSDSGELISQSPSELAISSVKCGLETRGTFPESERVLQRSLGTSEGLMAPIREITGNKIKVQFNVLLRRTVREHEIVGITGGCESLGKWDVRKAILLEQNQSDSDDHKLPNGNCENEENSTRKNSPQIWRTSKMVTFRCEEDANPYYRYFIGIFDKITEHIHIRHWETHLNPRKIEFEKVGYENIIEINDEFGIINNEESVYRGWLTTESILQFTIFSNSLIFNKSLDRKNIFIRLIPIKDCPKNTNIISPLDDAIHKCDDDPYRGTRTSHATEFSLVEILKFTHFSPEEQNILQIHNPEERVSFTPGKDNLIFHVTLRSYQEKRIAFLIEFSYKNEQSDERNSLIKQETPYHHLGYQYILPNQMKSSQGNFHLSIINKDKNIPVGLINLRYLLVNPMKQEDFLRIFDMSTTYVKQWRLGEWTNLNIGHRGCGATIKVDDPVKYPENTLATFKMASRNGADLIEFDVHLTKDLIPIVFHDFEILIKRNDNELSELLTSSLPKTMDDLLRVPVKDITLEQLRNSQIYIYENDKKIHLSPPYYGDKDRQRAPKLEELFDSIESDLPFLIEVKWPQRLINNEMEGVEQTIDKNLYVDKILEVILRKGIGSKRCIIVTSFDIEICTMLRYKQHIYPVIFLALGFTDLYPLYKDPRCNDYILSLCNARAMEFIGIGIHSQDLIEKSEMNRFSNGSERPVMKISEIIKLTKELNMVIFCWGDEPQTPETLTEIRDSGIDGIIYDNVHKFSAKTNKIREFRQKATEIFSTVIN